MKLASGNTVIKISVSDIERAKTFYNGILGFSIDDEYTINKGGTFGNESYLQLTLQENGVATCIIGLYKDINTPYHPKPQTGTVLSFIVDKIEAVLMYLQAHHVTIDKFDEKIIIENISDAGFVDNFFFFRDPDNNSLVIRQNFGTHKSF